LFDVAVSGPLAGLVIAIAALWVGLQSSVVLRAPLPAESGFFGGGSSISSSFLFGLLARLSLGDALEAGNLLRLSPLAFAGWLGLLVTALNLLPIGQLDGGHIGRAMFGDRAGNAISSLAMWSLILLAVFVWPGLMMWAIIVFFIARRGTPPLNDLTPLNAGRRWLGYFSFLILAMILVPLPDSFWQTAKLHCPYL
jgi:membrane-associated protease RseP (regulator of RpoE activity)